MSREFDAIHDALMLDSKAVWRLLRQFLCSGATGLEAHRMRIDLIEDLMTWHPDELTDRLEILVGDCQSLRESIIEAQVPGSSPSLARFHALQERLMDSLPGNRWWIQASEFGMNADVSVLARNREEAIQEALGQLGRDATILRVSQGEP